RVRSEATNNPSPPPSLPCSTSAKSNNQTVLVSSFIAPELILYFCHICPGSATPGADRTNEKPCRSRVELYTK
ncbi:TPA: hypothetical protein ACS29W_000936, partial [Klebsiella oxytoca]